jgi:hypothetical protein
MIAAAVTSSSTLPNASIVASQLSAPFSSSIAQCRKSPRRSVTATGPVETSLLNSAVNATTVSLPLFRGAHSRSTYTQQLRPVATPTRPCRHRRSPTARPHLRSPSPLSCRRHLPLCAPAHTARLRRPGQAGGLSRLAHGPSTVGAVEPLGPQTPRQRTALAHQRLQLRRSPRSVRGA